jgi:branched-chain amino acid transport system substrate-binding protein
MAEAKSKGFPAKVVVALVLGLLIGIGVGFGVFQATLTAPTSTQTETGTPTETVYKIGFTLPLSGELSSIGNLWRQAVDIAIEDLNNEVKEYGFNVRFEAVVLDDKTKDEDALKNVQSLHQLGIVVIIGPAASSQVKAVKSYADANKLVIISPSSTAPTLAIPDDFIFRNTGSDAIQAKALAALVAHEGIKNVVVFHRDDEYGRAFAEFFEREFQAFGGTSTVMPYATGLSDYASEVARLSSKVQEVGAEAVVLISFDTDGANILSHAKDDLMLSNVRWFSSEGIHGASELTQPELAEFLMSIKFLGTRPVFKENPLYKEFAQEFRSVTGTDPPVFTEKLYDAVFLAGWSILRAGSYDGEAIKNALPKVAEKYYGASGWCILDDNGDRLMQDYAIWTITQVGENFEFEDIGTYSGGTITIEVMD